MTLTLRAAAVYNLLWAAVVVLFPSGWFRLAGMPEPTYPQLWQCIGMIVGVYGVGYWVAARDPLRHWPIILVGLLGKVFGPIGFAAALAEGAFTWTFGLTIITNDLIWWVPFSVMLWAAFRGAHGRDDLPLGLPRDRVAALLDATPTSEGVTIGALSRDRPALLVLLRHFGCTFCGEALSHLAAALDRLEAAGVQPVVVHQSPPRDAVLKLAPHGLEGVPHVSDPHCDLYRGLGLPRGKFGQLLGPKVFARGLDAFVHGHGVGRLRGDGFQMPGVFRVEHGRVVAGHVAEHAGEKLRLLDVAGVDDASHDDEGEVAAPSRREAVTA